MTPFQWVLLPLLGSAAVYTFVAWRRGAIRLRGLACLQMVLLAGALLVAWPDFSTTIAQALGVGRGVNLLLYITVLTLLVSVTTLTLRINKIQRDVTLLTRELAIRDAHRTKTAEPSETFSRSE